MARFSIFLNLELLFYEIFDFFVFVFEIFDFFDFFENEQSWSVRFSLNSICTGTGAGKHDFLPARTLRA